MSTLRKIVEHQLEQNNGTVLCLSYLDVAPIEWEQLPQIFLEKSPAVRRVKYCDLGGNEFGKPVGPHVRRNLDFLTQSIAHLHSLEHLDLRDNKILTDGAIKVFSVLSETCPSTLAEIDLSENMIRDAGIMALSRANLPYITSMNLISNFITPQGVTTLSDFFKNTSRNLRKLFLDNNPLGNEGVSTLCYLLIQHEVSLEEIHLGDVLMGDSACRSLATMFHHMGSRLKVINLNVNRIGPHGVRALLHGICPVIRSREAQIHSRIDLGGNPLGDEGVCVLARFLRCLTGMKEIDLTCVRMGNTGARTLRSALILLKSQLQLESLCVDGNVMEDEIGVALVEWRFHDHERIDVRKSVLRECLNLLEDARCNFFEYVYEVLEASYRKPLVPLSIMLGLFSATRRTLV